LAVFKSKDRFKDTGGDRVDTRGRSGREVREREGAGGKTKREVREVVNKRGGC
jgi:hypothetical protein